MHRPFVPVRTVSFILLTALCVLTGGSEGRAAAQAAGTPATRQAPSGVVPLPTEAPPTGPQAPIPAPVRPVPPGDKPTLVSPSLQDIQGVRAAKPLTINDAVAIAIATNRSIALAQESVLRAQGRTAEVRAALSPTVSGNFTYTRLSQGTTANIGGRPTTLVNADQPSLGLSLNIPIFTDLLRDATTQARFQEIASRLDINRTRNQIVLDVKSAFYDVLRAQALVTVATETLQNSLDRLEDSQKRYRAGVVARFDVLRAETDVLNAQQGVIQSRSQVSTSIANLNNTIGIDINSPTEIADQGAVEDPPGVAPPAPIGPAPAKPQDEPLIDRAQYSEVRFDSLRLGSDYDAVTKEALQKRPEVLESDANIAAARKGIRIAERSLYPSVSLSVGGAYSPLAAGFSPQFTTAQAVVSLSVPIFEGGLARARVQQARADIATAETNKRQTQDQITLEVRTAYLQLVQSRDRVAVANKALAQAQEAFRLARVRYNAGVSAQAGISPLLEVSDAQAALTQAENNRVNALYDYNNSRARLDKSAGRYSYIRQGPGYTAPPAIK